MAEEDNSWVFDSLVCFLHGPIWNAPLQNFIEDKSIIFDPNIPMDIKNPEYLKLHVDYKNLVDFMLGSFMEEMQITPAKFEMACLEGRNQQQQDGLHNPRAFHQRLFQQIWAANDIRIFVRMMTQRNVELQLQALDLIERRQSSREASRSEDGPGAGDPELAAIAASDLIEFNEQGGDDALIETSAEELLQLSGGTEDESQHGAASAEGTATSEEVVVDQESTSSSTVNKTISDKFDRLNLFFENEKVNEEEVKQRQGYLRAQRDKILEIKKRTRARQLNETVKTSARPSSAQAAAQKILSGDEPPEPSLVLRRALAKRFRDEVVDGKKGA